MILLHTEEEQQQKNVVVEKAKAELRKLTLKKAAKALKHGSKMAFKLALNISLAAIKAVSGFLLSIGLPYILAILGVLFAVFVIYIATTMIFSSDVVLDGEAKRLQEYIKQAADSTVDMSRPEQVPYKVHEELITSVLQLYESEKTGKSTKEAIDIIASELKPIFEYTEKEGYIEYEVTSCTTTEEEGTVCNTNKYTKKFTLNLLTHVTAWNGVMTADVIETTGPWVVTTESSGDTTVTTRSRAHSFYTEEQFTEDYSHFEDVLMNAPFNYGEKDLAIIEILYMSTGRSINYTDMKGDSSFGGWGPYLDVIPGAMVPAEFMPHYLAAQAKYGVDWFYLAAIHWVETGFSTHPTMISSVGAEGHFQFMPCTWHGWAYPACKSSSNGYAVISPHDKYNPKIIAKYGGYGVDADGNGVASPWDIKDAVFTAARLLQANGFSKDPIKAICGYNKGAAACSKINMAKDSYVVKVMTKAEEIKNSSYIGSGSLANSAGFISPAKGRLTSKYGYRNIGQGSEFHKGVDIANSEKTPIYAAANGVVTAIENRCPSRGGINSTCGSGGRGNYVRILHKTSAGTFEVFYQHLYSVNVKKGQEVKQGQVIGLMGMSGRVTGPHLHFEMYKDQYVRGKDAVNPELLIPL